MGLLFLDRKDNFDSLFCYIRIEYHFPLGSPILDCRKIVFKQAVCYIYIRYSVEQRRIISK